MRRAFTLIELLVVVAVIAIVTAMLFPTFAQARENARRLSCMSNVRQLAVAQMMYLQDFDERLPFWWFGETRWTEMFRPYVRDDRLYFCRSTVREREPDRHEKRLADYAFYTWGPGGRGSTADPHWRWAGWPMLLCEVKRPAETFNLMDGYTLRDYTRGFVTRHSPAGVNAACLDGHARWFSNDAADRVEQDERGEWYYYYAAADR